MFKSTHVHSKSTRLQKKQRYTISFPHPCIHTHTHTRMHARTHTTHVHTLNMCTSYTDMWTETHAHTHYTRADTLPYALAHGTHTCTQADWLTQKHIGIHNIDWQKHIQRWRGPLHWGRLFWEHKLFIFACKACHPGKGMGESSPWKFDPYLWKFDAMRFNLSYYLVLK